MDEAPPGQLRPARSPYSGFLLSLDAWVLLGMPLGRDSIWDWQVQIDYLSSVSTLAFSTLEHSHNKQCRAQMARTVAKYEKVETALGQERETR